MQISAYITVTGMHSSSRIRAVNAHIVLNTPFINTSLGTASVGTSTNEILGECKFAEQKLPVHTLLAAQEVKLLLTNLFIRRVAFSKKQQWASTQPSRVASLS